MNNYFIAMLINVALLIINTFYAYTRYVGEYYWAFGLHMFAIGFVIGLMIAMTLNEVIK
jgi:hypothetical protein